MHKTQVFIQPEGDHYRTRLTHTLEVSQIARTIARSLRLNEDLAEAIALGHDVGHTPFGHAGESALDECLRERSPELGFKHYEQSLRVLTVLTPVNLTLEVCEGIAGHSKGRSDLKAFDGGASPSLEAAIVRVADRIAYLNHDLDDALRAGWLDAARLPREITDIGSGHSARIASMVGDIVSESSGKPVVAFSTPMLHRVNAMKEFMFEAVYMEYPRRFTDVGKAHHVVRALFQHFAADGSRLPNGYDGLQGGMTDRFASRLYSDLFVPTEWTPAG
jgi:dGTPase